MTEKYIFADVDLPFHVWVREGARWVLRDAGESLEGDGPSCPPPPILPGRPGDFPTPSP